MRRAGVEPVRSLIRGGTDGARLSEKGLPTPNLFTGGQNYHSRREWASVQDMAAAAATVVELVQGVGGDPGDRLKPARLRSASCEACQANRDGRAVPGTKQPASGMRVADPRSRISPSAVSASGHARRSRASRGRSGASLRSAAAAQRPCRSARTRPAAATPRSCGGRRSPRPRASAGARRACGG